MGRCLQRGVLATHCFDHLAEGWRHDRLGSSQADSGPQARHDFEPIEVRIEVSGASGTVSVGFKQQVGVERKVDFRRRPRIGSKELRRSYADYGEGNIVDQNGLAGGIDGSAKAFLAEREADRHDGRGAGAVVFRTDQASRGGGVPRPRK